MLPYDLVHPILKQNGTLILLLIDELEILLQQLFLIHTLFVQRVAILVDKELAEVVALDPEAYEDPSDKLFLLHVKTHTLHLIWLDGRIKLLLSQVFKVDSSQQVDLVSKNTHLCDSRHNPGQDPIEDEEHKTRNKGKVKRSTLVPGYLVVLQDIHLPVVKREKMVVYGVVDVQVLREEPHLEDRDVVIVLEVGMVVALPFDTQIVAQHHAHVGEVIPADLHLLQVPPVSFILGVFDKVRCGVVSAISGHIVVVGLVQLHHQLRVVTIKQGCRVDVLKLPSGETKLAKREVRPRLSRVVVGSRPQILSVDLLQSHPSIVVH